MLPLFISLIITQQIPFFILKFFPESSLQEQTPQKKLPHDLAKSKNSVFCTRCKMSIQNTNRNTISGKWQVTLFPLVLLFIGFMYLPAQAQGLASIIEGDEETTYTVQRVKCKSGQHLEQEGQTHES